MYVEKEILWIKHAGNTIKWHWKIKKNNKANNNRTHENVVGFMIH